MDYEKALSICRSPKDKHGHSETISFRTNPMYPRLAAELLAREPAFKIYSDLYRTALRMGFGGVLRTMKEKGKIGDEADDILLALDEMEKIAKADEAYRRIDYVISNIHKSLAIYRGNQSVLKQKLAPLEEKISRLQDPFWRDRLQKKFRKRMRELLGDWGDEVDLDDSDLD